MAAVAQATFTKVSVRPCTARPVQTRRAVVCAAAPKERRQNPAKAAFAGLCAAAIIAAQVPMPAQADAGVKSVVCASNPTSKICLKDSAKK